MKPIICDICEDCGHLVSRHGSEGCDVELGDAWVEGQNSGALMAQGPCGCAAWQEQTEAAA